MIFNVGSASQVRNLDIYTEGNSPPQSSRTVRSSASGMLFLHTRLLGRYLEYLKNYPAYISIIPFPIPHVVKSQHTTGQQP